MHSCIIQCQLFIMQFQKLGYYSFYQGNCFLRISYIGGKDGMLTWNTLLVIIIIYYYVVWRKYGELDFKRARLILSRRIFSSIFDKRATPLYLGVS